MYSLPAARTYDWATYCGIPGGIPVRDTIYQTMTTANTAAEINTAIANCTSGQVVYLAAGTYSPNAYLTLGVKSGVTVRGAGAGQTILQFASGISDCIRCTDRYFDVASAIVPTSGYTKGSTSLTFSSAPGGNFVAGNLFAICEDTDPDKWATQIGGFTRNNIVIRFEDLVTEGDRIFHYISRITSVVGNTINFASPLPLDFKAGNDIKVYAQNGSGNASLCGFESLTIDGNNATGRDAAVRYYGADRCWFKDVEIKGFSGGDNGLIQLNQSFQCEVRRNYIHDVYNFPSQPDGVAIGFVTGCCNCLGVDNISKNTSTMYQINAGAANVTLYDYIEDPSRLGLSANGMVGSGIDFHSGQAYMCLTEGSIMPRYQMDGYHGSSSHSTLFRNQIHGLHVDLDVVNHRRLVSLCRWSYYCNVVGNVLGDSTWNPFFYDMTGGGLNLTTNWSIYSLGYPSSDTDTLTPESSYNDPDYTNGYPDPSVASTILRHGNYDYYNDAAVNADGEDTNLPNSLFYTTKPSFFGTLTWPPIEPSTPAVNDIPAKWRWDTYAGSATLSDLFADSPSSSTYALYIDPESRTISAGAEASYTVSSVADDGYAGNVTLSVTGLPSGASAEFSDNPIDSDGGTSALTITTTTGATAGVHPLVLKGEEA